MYHAPLEAADAYGQAGPLSDLIIAERVIDVAIVERLSGDNPNDHP